MSDVTVIDQGTLVGFTPVSDLAQEWFADNVASEGWQWMGPTLWVDHRLAQRLLEGILGEGLVI